MNFITIDIWTGGLNENLQTVLREGEEIGIYLNEQFRELISYEIQKKSPAVLK